MKHPARHWSLPLLGLALLIPSVSAGQGKRPPSAEASTSARPTVDEPVGKPASSAATADKPADNGLFIRKDDLRPLYFASGQSELTVPSMQMLKENVDWLKRNMPLHILVAGYSDGQGTPEQNLAMGQRRAGALRDFYVSMGIPRSRISTVSYGQEEPACFDATEECRAQNRRVETWVENKELASR